MSFHIPDLDALERMPDLEVRFYAIVGVLMSLTGAMERLEFTMFRKGTQLSEQVAAAIFYAVKNDGARTQMARAAMDGRMGSDPTWKAIAARLGDKTATTARNLVSHNPGTRIMRPIFQGLLALTNHIPEQIVEQDPVQVRLGKAEATADFQRLRLACEHLHPLHEDLKAFLDKLA